MKTLTKTNKEVKNIDLLISKISLNEILGINEMICIRGGDGDENYPLPPNPPKQEN